MMMGMPDTDRFRTFEQWSGHLLSAYNSQEPGERHWFAVGDWLINSKENNAYKEERVGYHVCMGNYQRMYATELGIKNPLHIAASVTDIEEGCLMCGEYMPDGIKMIALLEKL